MIALGLTTLVWLPTLSDLASPAHLAVYHFYGSATGLFVPVLVALAIWWASLTCLLIASARFRPLRIGLWTLVALCLPWLLRVLSQAAKLEIPTRYDFLTSALAAACLLVFFRRSHMTWPLFATRLIHAAETGFFFFGWAGILLLSQVLWSFREASGLSPGVARAPTIRSSLSAQSPVKGPHCIWILLDELSYAQTYERRFPGLQLPAFDRLAAQSIVFTHVVPAGYHTQEVLPSLLTGLSVQRVRSSADGRQLTLETVPGAPSGSPESHSFDQHDTVFSDARSLDYGTAVVGWYNPYCRILSDVLDRCFWTIDSRLPLNPLATYFGATTGLAWRADLLWPDRRYRDLHIDEYRQLMSASQATLASGADDFVFLHLPVPHSPGIYDRQTGTLTDSGRSSYVDNLALADKTLGELRATLEARGEWDSSAILVMGDHSWRAPGWRRVVGWTREDDAAMGDSGFDDRPGYIVKMPGQQQGVRFDGVFAATRTRGLIDQILTRKIATPDELTTWAAQPRRGQP
jgi:hypothetical protein